MYENQAIEKLETHIFKLQEEQAFTSESVYELEKTVVKQQLEIQKLQKQIKILSEYTKNLKQETIKDIRDESPPPHY